MSVTVSQNPKLRPQMSRLFCLQTKDISFTVREEERKQNRLK